MNGFMSKNDGLVHGAIRRVTENAIIDDTSDTDVRTCNTCLHLASSINH